MAKNKQGVRPIRIVKLTFHDTKPLSMEERSFLTLVGEFSISDRELRKIKNKSKKKKEVKVEEEKDDGSKTTTSSVS